VNVELYERIWMWLAAALIVAFLGAITLTAGLEAVGPPGHMETVNPATLDTNPEFGEPGVKTMPDGSVVVSVVARLFSFDPDPIEVPANRPVTFRLTSADVIHGFLVIGTNANAMAVPGYVNQFTVTFPTPGEYVIACDEYCGVLHANMVAKLIVRKELP
jgi:cytochrome c oxidase subunit II